MCLCVPQRCPFHSIIWHFDGTDEDDNRNDGDDGENDDGDGSGKMVKAMVMLMAMTASGNAGEHHQTALDTESIFSQHNTFIQAINIRNCCHLERYSDSRNMHNWVVWASNLNRDIIHAEYVLCAICVFHLVVFSSSARNTLLMHKHIITVSK